MKVTIQRDFPPIAILPPGTILGSQHFRTPQGEIIIPERFARTWNQEVDTETRFVRQWLNTLPRQRRQKAVVLQGSLAQPPLLAAVGGIKEAVYIDISAAYPSIWQRLGWEVEYFRNEYLSLARPLIFPFPMSWKIGRSMPVSSNREGWVKIWNGREIKIKKYLNRNFNPSVRWATLDVLQAVATMAQRFGAIYFNTDGCILPAARAEEYCRMLHYLGLGFKIKGEGHAYVGGLHAVVIGEKSIGAGMSNPGGFSNLIFSQREAEWLLSRFASRPAIPSSH